MKKIFFNLGDLFLDCWKGIISILAGALSAVFIFYLGISCCTPLSDDIVFQSYDMWYGGINYIDYDTVTITTSNKNIDIDSLYKKGLVNSDTTNINVSVTLKNGEILKQDGKIISIYRKGVLNKREKVYEIDFSAGEPVVKAKKYDFIEDTILWILTIFCIAFVLFYIMYLILALIEEKVTKLIEVSKVRKSKK